MAPWGACRGCSDLSSGVSYLLVAIAGGCGALTRWVFDQVLSRLLSGRGERGHGIAAVNIIGSFFIGVLAAITYPNNGAAHGVWILGSVGFLGAFTTFSTAMFDAYRDYAEGQWRHALVLVMITWVNAVLGCLLGIGMGSLLS